MKANYIIYTGNMPYKAFILGAESDNGGTVFGNNEDEHDVYKRKWMGKFEI